MTQVQTLKTELVQFRNSYPKSKGLQEPGECQNQDSSPIIQGAGKNPMTHAKSKQTVFNLHSNVFVYILCHMWVCKQTKEKSQPSQSFCPSSVSTA